MWRKYRLNEPDWTVIFVPFILAGILIVLHGVGQFIGNVLK